MAAQSFFIQTFGCQMNVYDSGRMADVLLRAGYRPATQMAEADVIIFNTCHIREKASEKVFSELGRLRNHGGIKIVAGCVAQAEEELIRERAPFVNVIMGPLVYNRLLEFIEQAKARGPVINTEFPVEAKFDTLPMAQRSGFSEFIAVQEGCDRFCTYCVVPYTRGNEYSRPVREVVEEIRRKAELGAVEITLLGQNVNAYHGDGKDLAFLIGEVAKIPGIQQIRYTTSYPADMNEALIRAHGDIAKLMPFVHVPVQSGSNRVLKAMNRRHSAEFYGEVVDKLRAARADMAISSDFIVGFPGETDEDFADTLALIERVNFASYFAFKYSARPGTAAADFAGQIPESVKSERLKAVQALLNKQKKAFNKTLAGKEIPVLMLESNRGYSQYMQVVHTNAGARPGTIVPVTITEALANSLKGEINGV
jgi:tRNA-2-methylthio-N6-dimethylallyladenosine synthase